MKTTIRPYRHNKTQQEVDITFGNTRKTWVVPEGIYQHIPSATAQRKAIETWAENKMLSCLPQELAKPQVIAQTISKIEPEPSLTAGDFFPQFICKLPECSPNTISNFKKSWRLYLNPFLGHLELDKINQEVLAELTQSLKERTKTKPGANTGFDVKYHKRKEKRLHLGHNEKLAPRTINNILTCLGAVLHRAQRWGKVNKIPSIDYLPVDASDAKIDDDKYYDEAEEKALVETATQLNPHVLVYVLLGVDAGLRISEMAALTWEQIKFDTRKIVVDKALIRTDGKDTIKLPKSDKKGTVMMTDRLYAALKTIEPKPAKGRVLRRQLLDTQHATSRVALDDFGQVKEVSCSVLSYWNKILTREAHKVCPSIVQSNKSHACRHTAGSKVARLTGGNAFAVKAQLRHSHINTSQIYVHGEYDDLILKALNQ